MRWLLLLFFTIIISTVCRAGTFAEIHNISCQQSLTIGHLGYPTWNTAKIIKGPTNGSAKITNSRASFDTLVYQPKANFHGTDTIIVVCARATQISCDTGYYIINVSCTSDLNSSQNQETKLLLSQNPIATILTIRTNLDYESLALVTIDGKVLQKWNGSRNEIPIGHLVPGYYGVVALFRDESWVLELFLKR